MNPERALVWAGSGLAVAATLAIGGVHPVTQVVLSAAALLVTIGFLWIRGRRGVSVAPFVLPAALALAYTAFQLLPLPSALVHLLSPHAHQLRSEVLGHTPLFFPLTLDVPATLLELVKGFACLGLLIVIGGLTRPMARAHRALYPIAFIGGALAIYVIGQRLAGAQTVLGFYHAHTMPGSGVFGTLVNGNHAASIFALSALTAVGLALELEGVRRFLMLWSAGLSFVGLLFTTSRGGAVGLAVGGAVLAVITISRRLGRLQGTIAALVLMAVAGSGALWLGDGLRARLVPSTTQEIWSNRKTRGWRDGFVLTENYPLTGVGRGAFEAPVAAYRESDEGVRLVYPENIIVQVASEWGLPMAAALLLLTLAAARRVAPRVARLEAGTVGAACGVLAVMVHELVDFGLEMPGVALPTVVALGVVIGRWQERLEVNQPRRRVRPLWCAAACGVWACLLLAGAWAVPRTLDADSTRVALLRKAQSPAAPAELDAAIVRHPASDYLELVAATDALARRDPSALKHLNRSLVLHPANAQAHHLAARTVAQMGNLGQAALEYRLTWESGLYPPYAELWTILHARIIDAVPLKAEEQLALGVWLAASGHPNEADLACTRALSVATRPDAVMRERLRIAQIGNDRPHILAAARAILDARPDAASWVLAAQALTRAGETAAGKQAIVDGERAHPDDTALLLAGAQLFFETGDLVGARAQLKREGDGHFSLTDRKQAAELTAQIAERLGDADGAVMARARARILARKLDDSSVPMPLRQAY